VKGPLTSQKSLGGLDRRRIWNRVKEGTVNGSGVKGCKRVKRGSVLPVSGGGTGAWEGLSRLSSWEESSLTRMRMYKYLPPKKLNLSGSPKLKGRGPDTRVESKVG